MISRVRFESVRQFLFHGAPPLVVSMVTAEMFFKFHSFILESMSFLAVWYALGAALSALRSKLAVRED